MEDSFYDAESKQMSKVGRLIAESTILVCPVASGGTPPSFRMPLPIASFSRRGWALESQAQLATGRFLHDEPAIQLKPASSLVDVLCQSNTRANSPEFSGGRGRPFARR